MRVQLPFVVLVAVVFACATPAQAQRVFVSATGSDGNSCTFASPCRTFQHAHNTTAAGGEIDVLDPAGYGPLTITKSISIQGHGFSGITVAPGANGITINAGSSDAITLNGLLIDGAGAGYNGVVFNSGGNLTVTNCLAQNFPFFGGNFFTSGNGIAILPTAGTVKFAITNTTVSNNGTAGILYAALSGTPGVTGVIDHVEATANNDGISIQGAGGSQLQEVAISNSTASNNGAGIQLVSAGTEIVSIDNVTVTGNSEIGIQAAGANIVALLSRSVIQGNSIGIWNETSNTFYTYGNNLIDLNVQNFQLNPLNSTVKLR
jgi:hypothetical protein